MDKFKINKDDLCSVQVSYGFPDNLLGTITTTYVVDHPSFQALRNHLSAKGYIAIREGVINGDLVLCSFYLNDIPFWVGDVFPCASAMSIKQLIY